MGEGIFWAFQKDEMVVLVEAETKKWRRVVYSFYSFLIGV